MLEKPASRSLLDDAMQAYYHELCKTARRHGHNPAVANEIVHDLYIRLTQKPNALNGRRSLKAFLKRACVNLGIDRFRRERFERQLFSGTEQEALFVASETRDADGFADRRHRLAILHTAILEMSVQRRRVFLASTIAQMTSSDISERMGLTRNMVDRHLRKAYLHCLTRLDDTL